MEFLFDCPNHELNDFFEEAERKKSEVDSAKRLRDTGTDTPRVIEPPGVLKKKLGRGLSLSCTFIQRCEVTTIKTRCIVL